MLRDLTHELVARGLTCELTREEVAAAMSALVGASEDDAAKADFLRVWAQRGESGAELAFAAEALLPCAVDPGIRGTWNDQPLLDCCGTGGGGLNLLNISTGIVFILAAMGIPVLKHGNRGITKKSGSADVLEALGIKIDLQPDQVQACLDEVGAAFLYAPLYHTSFAAIAPVRKQLASEGQRTIFNLLGPLLNPARPDARLVGVFKEEHVLLYFDALTAMQCPRFAVACGEDKETKEKLGEVGTITIFASTMSDFDKRMEFSFFPSSQGDQSSLLVEGASDSAHRLTAILSSEETGFACDLMVLNAAVAARMHRNSPIILASFINEAYDAIKSSRALAVLRKWQAFSAQI